MHLQIEPKLMTLMRKKENEHLRQFIKSLRVNQYPEWATEAKDKPGEYHFLADDVLVVYRIDDTGDMETVIKLVIVEA